MNARVNMASGTKQPVRTRTDDLGEGANVVCIQNIGPVEQRRRLTFGVVTLSAGIAIALLLIWAGVNPLWRLLLFFPFASGATGFFQAREKT